MNQPIDSFQQAVVDPEIDLDTAWWWHALGEGRLELPRCRACERSFFPPQPTCSHCGSRNWERIRASGKGRIYSWVVAHQAFDPRFANEVPYPIVAVEMDEGVRLIGRYRGPADTIRDGTPVRAFIYCVAKTHLLGFEPSQE